MNKTELIAAVAEKAGMSKKDADNAVNAVINAIVEAVANDEKVQKATKYSSSDSEHSV